MYIFYIHMHTAWITRTVLQFYRKQFFWIGSLWSTRHGITTLAAWLTGFEFYTQAQPAKDWRCCYVLILMVGDEEVYTKVGETMTIISEGWGWWHPVLHHHVGCRRTSYSEERVTLRHSGPRKTWRVEKGSSLIPLQRTHIHTTCWFWIVWIICALIFSCINEVTAPDFSYSTCSYSIWLLYSLHEPKFVYCRVSQLDASLDHMLLNYLAIICIYIYLSGWCIFMTIRWILEASQYEEIEHVVPW